MLAIVANLKRAARDRQSVEIGGGIFEPAELIQAAEMIELASRLAKLREGLDNGSSAAEDAVANLAEQAQALIQKVPA